MHYDRHQDAFAYSPEPGEVFGILYQGLNDSIVRVWVPDQIDVYASEMVGPHKGAIIRATDLEIYFLILSGPKGPGEGEYEFSLFDLSDLGDTKVSHHPDSFSFRMAAVHIARYRFGDESLEHAQTLDRLADVLAESGRFAEAGENLERSLRIRERRFGPVSQESIGTVRSIAKLYREDEMYREAIPFHQRLVDNNRAGSDGPSVEQAMDAHRLGFVFYRADDYAAATEAWEESATIHDTAPDRNVSLFALTLYELGSVHRKMGNTAESLLWRQRREEFIRTTDLRNSDTHASALNTLGVAHANYGDDANAMRSYRHAIEMRDVLGLSDTSPQATTHSN